MRVISGLCLCFLLQLTDQAFAATNLLKNPNFEEDFNGNWFCDSCTLTRTTDKLEGQYAAQVTKRTRRIGSVKQEVEVTGPALLFFKINVKLLNVFDQTDGHALETYAYIRLKSGSGYTVRFSKVLYIFPSSGWVEIGGDFEIPEDTASVAVFVPTDRQELNFVVDKAELTKGGDNSNWVSEANDRIRQIRRGDITLKFNVASKYDPSKVKVQVTQNQHDFRFGFGVSAIRMYATDAINLKYQDFAYSLGNTFTLSNIMKWRFMESDKDNPNFYHVDKAIEAIKAHNASIRGHCLTWAKTTKVVEWLQSLSAAQIKDNVQRRINYIGPRYKGKISQYDVNNENLHGYWYESHTGDPNFTEKMFNWMHQQDPEVELCLNDYNVIVESMFTMAFKREASLMLSHGTPVSCLGIQSHFITGDLPSPAGTLKRLDTLAETGLKLWITELDFQNSDINIRAQGYKDALRLFFSHPAVEGIIMWAPWDLDNGGKPSALVEGNNFDLNLAGNKVKYLINGQWKTRETITPSSRTASVTFPGFYGGYEVAVYYDGNKVSTSNFYIAKGHTATHQVNLA